jgi:hypothetical protein
MKPATTQQMIDDVRAARDLKRIDLVEAEELELALRRGEIIHPLWEDYGLKTNPANGRAMS